MNLSVWLIQILLESGIPWQTMTATMANRRWQPSPRHAPLVLGVSIFTAIIITGRFKRAIFGLEPEEIARLFQERDATLQSVKEGIIAINRGKL